MASSYIEPHKALDRDTGVNQTGDWPEGSTDTNIFAGKKRPFSEYLGSSEDLELPISKLRRMTISDPSLEFLDSLVKDAAFEKLLGSNNYNLLGLPRSAEETAPGINRGLLPTSDTSLANSKGNSRGIVSDVQSPNTHKSPPGPLGALRYPLYKHQLIAVEWMKKIEKDEKKRGGILADDMGLGKTLTAIALMVSRNSEPSPWANIKTNLIVAPVSLLNQWQREIKQKILPGHRLRVFLHHSVKKSYKSLCKYDVVLTSYGMLVSEYKRREDYITQAVKDGLDIDNDYLSEICPFISPKSYFYRVILDEAQYIKNPKAKGSLAVCELKAKYRWCLTGTPMQNGPNELAPLVRFLRIQPYCDIEKFHKEFGSLQPKSTSSGTTDGKALALKSLQSLLRAILLRRTKKDKIDGKPIIQLKEKIEVITHVIFDTDQKEFYDALEKDSRVQFSKYLRSGTIGRHYTKVLVLLLRLRQACCHPHLHLTDLELVTPDIPEEQAEMYAQRLAPEAVEYIKGTGPFQCSVCCDVISAQPSVMCPCADLLCSPCAEAFANMMSQIRMHKGEGQASREATKCPACNGEGDFAIIKFNSFLKVHQPERLEGGKELESGGGTDDSDDSDEDLAANLVPKKLAKLAHKARHNLRAREKYMQALRSVWQPSAKVTKCCEIIASIQNTTQEKIIIFSQWTVFLDLIQIAIEDELGLRVGRYVGSMTARKRDEAVGEFNEDPSLKVMLVSLKAGNAGLNLTVASQVIIMDPFWNPYVENQAIDRTYRIGQQRDVTVHHILVEGTVEDRIMATQDRKRRIVECVQGGNASNPASALGTEDLAFLFGVNPRRRSVPASR
ncbi:hypothetical protein Daesc_006959 [Daldinia eschscholtzii]|uniref:Uncharacterized protein n=1 Tax=Daldinia eschscholtzii TaxID=292717 RepID=A0AAX6MJR8_9PEZI